MVYCHSSCIWACKLVDQPSNMTFSPNSNHACPKSRQRNIISKNKKMLTSQTCSKAPYCDCPRFPLLDVLISIAVLCSFSFLLFPCIKYFCLKSIEFGYTLGYVLTYEVGSAPLIYTLLGFSILCAMIAFSIVICTTNKCRNPNCKGLRNSAEFDIQLETEERVKSSGSSLVKRGLFELSRDHHIELQDELKKIAPLNGRAVLVFRAKCGCSVGRLEVPGMKKQRRIKK